MDRYAGFAEFVQARERSLLRTAYLLTTDAQLAEDLVQSAMAKAATRWPRIRTGNPEGYIRRAMYTESVSWWRRRHGVREVSADQLDRCGVASMADATDARITVLAALRRLSCRQRAVLVLRYYEDLSQREIADALGCSVGTVKSQTHDALARLRKVAPELADVAGFFEEVAR